MRPHDEVSRNRGEVAVHAALGLEPRTEFGLREELRQPRHDAAGDVNAAARAQRQCQIAGYRSEHGAEDRRRLARARIRIPDLRKRGGGTFREGPDNSRSAAAAQARTSPACKVRWTVAASPGAISLNVLFTMVCIAAHTPHR